MIVELPQAATTSVSPLEIDDSTPNSGSPSFGEHPIASDGGLSASPGDASPSISAPQQQHAMNLRPKSRIHYARLIGLHLTQLDVHEPHNIKEAMSSPNRTKAMKEERTALSNNGT